CGCSAIRRAAGRACRRATPPAACPVRRRATAAWSCLRPAAARSARRRRGTPAGDDRAPRTRVRREEGMAGAAVVRFGAKREAQRDRECGVWPEPVRAVLEDQAIVRPCAQEPDLA